MDSVLQIRQSGSSMMDAGDEDSWYSPKAVGIKWGIVGALILIFVLWIVGGYYHAKRRIAKGLPPLAYHRWLLPRAQRAQFNPRYRYYYQAHAPQRAPYGEEHQMYPPPPPVYTREPAPPPIYEPPEGASKTNPHQDWAAPPPGPPPWHPDAGGSSAAGPSTASTQMPDSSPEVRFEDPQRPTKAKFPKGLNPFK